MIVSLSENMRIDLAGHFVLSKMSTETFGPRQKKKHPHLENVAGFK